MSEAPVYKIYPSDLTWLYSSCPRCFYLKLRRKTNRPNEGFPQIFSKIDSAIKRYCLEAERTEAVCPDMPPGRFLADAPKSVLSRVFSLDGYRSRFELCGRPDAIVAWDAGGYGVLDFKTSAIKQTAATGYANQLEIYASALENPAAGRPQLDVTSLGLLVWEPKLFSGAAGELLHLGGQLAWVPVERRRQELRAMLRSVLGVLDEESPPQAYDSCKFCAYPSALAALSR